MNTVVLGAEGLQKRFAQVGVLMLFWTAACFASAAEAVSIEDIGVSSLSSNQVLLRLVFSDEIPGKPTSFTIDDPARIALDFPGATSALQQDEMSVELGPVKNVAAVESDGRTRVVVNLTRAAQHTVEIDGNVVLLTIGGDSVDEIAGGSMVDSIDFERGEDGSGRVKIALSDPATQIDLTQESGKIVLRFINAILPENLDRTLNVVDFATPVKEVDTRQDGRDVRMEIGMVTEDYDQLAYQSDGIYMVEFRPLSKEDREEMKSKKQQFTGERISLNFQSIPVRGLMQLFADFVGFNLVVSQSVQGNVSLRLKNVPWDQAMDTILRLRGLAKREVGNVVMIAPQEETAARERLELEAQQQRKSLSPLRTEYIKINYAQAGDLSTLIGTSGEDGGLLSERGNLSIDQRTNTLIVKDSADSIRAIRSMINELDVPIRQVLIESRIVNAENTFAKDIGVRFGYSKTKPHKNDGSASINLSGANGSDLMVDLPAVPGDAGSLALAIGKVGSYLLQLELSALIAEGRGEEISSPRVITANQSEAVIESGVQIPYQEASSSGATTVSFKDAVLSLKVTPQITPDEKVYMELQVDQDTVSSTIVNGVPAINTKSVTSQVLVDDGETVVLGGIYTHTERNSVDRIPFFSELPYLGFLFRRTNDDVSKNELLIFVTPKILKEELKI
ncbi:MAG: type IV pilus secretin PilQ [Candidatus Eutrophobiaceae bacterium]